MNEQISAKNYKIIFHIDMNCFFASCEIAQNPSLKGKPIVVAHDEPLRKSIILTASYEARKYGIKTTMITADAIRLCPSVIIVEPKHELYTKYSKLFFDYMINITDIYEPMSIDEGFFDMTEVCDNINPLELAKKIQLDLYRMYHLPCSIGIAPNKFLAKMASDMKKPLGITVLRKRDISTLLWPLPIESMIGVGKKSAPKLHEIGINTIGDILKYDNKKEELERLVGSKFSTYLLERAKGNDSSLVHMADDDDRGSVSNEHTFDFDINSVLIIKDTLKNLTNSICNRLCKHSLAAKTVGIKIRYSDFQTVSKSISLREASNDSFYIWNELEPLFDDFYIENKYIRLIGAFASRVENKVEVIKQYNLFDDFSKAEQEHDVKKLLNKLNNDLGENIIHIGIKK